MINRAQRDAIIEVAKRSLGSGLTHGTSGNVSCRRHGGMLITPSGIHYQALVREDIVAMDFDGQVEPGEKRIPSSEWRMHAAIYRKRPDVEAIVHGHSPAATAVACLGRDIPPFHYMIAIAGGDSIRCARYATFGTDELAELAVAALEGRRACLLANHGFLAVGRSLDEALAVAAETEFLADLYLRLLPLGEPAPLTAEQIELVRRRFAHYGQRPTS